MFVPNKVNAFGSTYKIPVVNEKKCSKMIKDKVMHIKKSHVKALDHPDQRCASKDTRFNTSACIASFIEKRIGCNPMVQGSQYSSRGPCTTRQQLQGLQNMTRVFEEADGNTILDVTGCLSSCEKDHFTIDEEPLKCYTTFGATDDKYKLTFKILDRSFKEEEQYLIYDTGSFIADVGGYMGLLLGCSLMSLYSEMEAFLKKLFCRPQSGNGINIC